METKVIILGQEPKTVKKKIEFIAYVMCDMLSEPNTNVLESEKPNAFSKIELLSNLGANYKHDLFRCTKENGVVYLMIGHFNDGIV